jgi:surface polysaccharide O-acyltransferase-like enzyme
MIFGGYAIFEIFLITAQFFPSMSVRVSISKIFTHPLFKKIIWLSLIFGFLLVIPILQRKYQIQAISDIGRNPNYFAVSADDPTLYIDYLGNGNPG